MEPSVVLAETVRKLVKAVESKGLRAVSVEVTYGEGALESVEREVLRDIASIERIHGLPLSLPEEIGLRPRLVEVVVRADGGGARAAIAPELLNASR